MRFFRGALLGVAAVAAVLAARPLAAAEDASADLTAVLHGVHLRQPLDEVRKLLPEMKEVRGRMAAGSSVDGPELRRFTVAGATPFGLAKPVAVELRFWNEKLWLALVPFGDNADAEVRAALEKRFGAKPATAEQMFWDGQGYSVALQMKPRWFAIQDPALTAEAQQWFLTQMGRKVAAPAAPPPTPAAAAAEK